MRSANLQYMATVSSLEYIAKNDEDKEPQRGSEDKAPESNREGKDDLPRGSTGTRNNDTKPPHSGEGDDKGEFVLHDAWFNSSWLMSNGTRGGNRSSCNG